MSEGRRQALPRALPALAHASPATNALESARGILAPGVVSLLAELRGHERQAAEELELWTTHHEERKPLDASQAAITLALLLTDEELDSLEKSGPLEMEKSRGADDQVNQVSQALNLLRAMVSLPKYSPLPRPPTSNRGWMA